MQSTNTSPATGFFRLSQIVGNPKAKPPIPAMIPVWSSTWWAWVKIGKAPAAVKPSERVTAWRAEDIHHFIAELGGKGGAA